MQRSGSSEERTGDLPQLGMVYLPNDHTQGTTPKSATPRSYIAGNDLASCYGLLAGLAQSERGEDLAHPVEDRPHPHQGHECE
jgi:hypothetical protein